MEENNNIQQTTSNPVTLEKPAKPEQQTQPVNFGGQPMNSNPNPVNFGGQPVSPNPNPVNFGGQPMNSNPNPVNFGGQPVSPNPNPVNFGGQPMNSNPNPVNFGGQPMNSNPNPVNFGGQPMNSNPNPVNFGGQSMNPNMNQSYNSNFNYGSNPYGGQPSNTAQGLQYAQPKKSKAGLIIGIAAALVVVLAAGIGVVFAKSMFGGAQQQLEKGFANMTKEMLAYSSSLSDDVGFDEIQKLTKEKPMHTNVDLTVEIPDSGESASVGFDAISDVKNKKGQADLSIGSMGFNLKIGTVTVDDDVLYFASDFVSNGDAYSIDLTTVGKDYNNSVWADYIGETLPDDLSYDLFGSFDNDLGTDAELAGILTKFNSNLSKAANYSKLNSKKECVIGDDTVECGGVSVTYNKDAFNDMIKEFKDDFLDSDYFEETLSQVESADDVREMFELILDMELENDYTINYYLDKKGRIVNISTPKDIGVRIADGEGSFSVDINFSGEERTLDTIDGGIYIGNGVDIIYLGMVRNASVTDELYSEDITIQFQQNDGSDDISLNYKNIWKYDDKSFDMSISLNSGADSLEFSADGKFKDIVKGKSYTLQVRNASIKENGEELASASCTISTEPADKEIEVPKDAVDFLKMSESDVYSLFNSLSSFY